MMKTESRPDTVKGVVEVFDAVLEGFGERGDYRAVFLHAYLIITRRFSTVIECQKSEGERVFLDVLWVESLLVSFANLYLDTIGPLKSPHYTSRTWANAHRCAELKQGTVIEDLLLGVNAHVNVDLAFAVYQALERESECSLDPLRLARRKFDYDQVNRILFECIDRIEDEISEHFGGAIGFLDHFLLSLDEALTRMGVRKFRERVWWHGLSLLSATTEEERRLVREKIEAQALEVAKDIRVVRWGPLSILHRVQRVLRRSDFGAGFAGAG